MWFMISAMDKFRADTQYSLYENAWISLEISLIDWLIDLYFLWLQQRVRPV